MAKKPKLNAKQEMFCKEYVIDLNGKQAAIRSGYAERSAEVHASRMLSDDKVRHRVQDLLDERSRRTEITADYVLRTIQETIERCKQAVPVLDKEGTPTGEWKFEHTGVLKGCELLGKHLKLFTDKVEHSGTIKLEDLVAGDE